MQRADASPSALAGDLNVYPQSSLSPIAQALYNDKSNAIRGHLPNVRISRATLSRYLKDRAEKPG